MLVLSRKEGQSVMVGDTKVTIIKSNGQVRLGFDGPQGTKIVRAELLEVPSDVPLENGGVCTAPRPPRAVG